MQGKINSFRAAFVDLAADYVKRVAVRAAQQEPEAAARALAIAMPGGETVKLNSAAEAYRLAGCIEEVAASVWPEAGKTT